MKEKLFRVAKWVLYPLFYVVCLVLFGYVTFPYERLRDRIVQEFARSEASHGASPPKRLEIDELSSYWFSGVEVEGARLIIPPSDEDVAKAKLAAADDETKPAARDAVLAIDEVNARLQLLPLLFGEVRVAFWASAFGGEITGAVPVGAGSGGVELDIAEVDLAKFSPLVSLIGVPLRGVASGTLALDAGDEGKFSKADGALDFTVASVSVGDGKTKIAGQVALPEAKLGDLVITAEAKEGVLKITKFSAPGPDIELVGDGKINVREPWDESTVDLYVRFKFADAYRDKNEITRSLLGAPGSKAPALFELADPKIKKAKRPDGFYGWHIYGPLKKLKFDPSAADGPSARPTRGKGSDTPAAPRAPVTPRAAPNTAFPLGLSKAKEDAVREQAPLPAPVREETPMPVAEPPPRPPPPTPVPRPQQVQVAEPVEQPEEPADEVDEKPAAEEDPNDDL